MRDRAATAGPACATSRPAPTAAPVKAVALTASWVDVVAASRPGSDGAGYIAFAVVAALFVASWFLYRSLRHHLRKIDFEERPAGGDARPDSDLPPT